MPKVGQWVEICQPGGHWLPFLVTHVYGDADTVSGVAFSGHPATVGWHRPTEGFSHVTRGESNRQWRDVDAPVAASGYMPDPDELNSQIRAAAAAAVAEAMAARLGDPPPIRPEPQPKYRADATPRQRPEASEQPDDLTVIPRLGDKAAEWLAGHGVETFDDLADILDADIAAYASTSDAPGGVSEERLREWRDAAAQRIA